jgi:hypothetical protein
MDLIKAEVEAQEEKEDAEVSCVVSFLDQSEKQTYSFYQHRKLAEIELHPPPRRFSEYDDATLAIMYVDNQSALQIYQATYARPWISSTGKRIRDLVVPLRAHHVQGCAGRPRCL